MFLFVLLEKIYKLGIRGICNDWFKSYLYNRTIQVQCENSEHAKVLSTPEELKYWLSPRVYFRSVGLYNFYK